MTPGQPQKTTRSAFRDKHVLLTGAASGIGRALALELARQGARLALVDIDAARLDETVRMARALGATASAYETDLADPDAVHTLATRVRTELGHVDLLFNNAGVAVVSPLARMMPDDWRWIVGVNLWGPVHLTQELLPDMIARRSGRIVMTASLAGLIGAPGMAAYSTTKFALVGFAESLRYELANSGVGVTVICPGHTRTNLHASTRYRNAGFERFLSHAPSWFGVTPERAARIALDAVAAERFLVAFGPEKAGWLLKRLSPELSFRAVRWIAERTGIDGLGTPSPAPGDLPCTSP